MDMSGQKAHYSAEREFSGCLTGCRWGLEVKDVAAFSWVNGEGLIEYQPLINCSPDRLRFWVLHTLLPIIFTLQQDFEFLHAGAVEINGKPVLFSAESFGGKSTLTDYFIGQGHKLLADDSLGIYQQDGGFYAVPSYPFQRPYRQLEVLGKPVSHMATLPKQVYSIYSLEKVGSDAEVHIRELVGVEKFKAFHFASFINFDFFRQRRFDFFADMAKVTPPFAVTVPWSMVLLAPGRKGKNDLRLDSFGFTGAQMGAK
jgi:hypothetical protein